MATRFSVSEWIDASPERVFAVCSDLDHAAAWMKGLVRIERLSGNGFQVGTRWREVRNMYGKEAFEEFELKSCEPPHKFTIYVDGSKGSSKKGEYFFDHTLKPENSGTRLEIGAVIDGMGWLGFFIGPIVRGFFKKAMQKDLQAMKDHIERLID